MLSHLGDQSSEASRIDAQLLLQPKTMKMIRVVCVFFFREKISWDFLGVVFFLSCQDQCVVVALFLFYTCEFIIVFFFVVVVVVAVVVVVVVVVVSLPAPVLHEM